MQDEVNTRVVALYISLGKKGMHLTAGLLKAAMRKYLQKIEKSRSLSSQKKAYEKAYGKHGKQTVGQLMKQNQGLTNIEITDSNIKSFERIANKYNIDFALKKDKSSELPKYVVFFKARDVDVMTQAFKEYSAAELTKSKKPSIRKLLERAIEKARGMDKSMDHNREKVKAKGREEPVL